MFHSLFTFNFTEYTFPMTEGHPSHLANSNLPMSAKHFQLYGRFWDVVSLFAFGSAAVTVIIAQSDALTWREITAAGLCVAQGLLYFFAIVRTGWPISRSRLTLYFVGGLGLWLLACWLNPFLWWLGFTYFGQMFGLLPLQAVIPSSGLDGSDRLDHFGLENYRPSHRRGNWVFDSMAGRDGAISFHLRHHPYQRRARQTHRQIGSRTKGIGTRPSTRHRTGDSPGTRAARPRSAR